MAYNGDVVCLTNGNADVFVNTGVVLASQIAFGFDIFAGGRIADEQDCVVFTFAGCTFFGDRFVFSLAGRLVTTVLTGGFVDGTSRRVTGIQHGVVFTEAGDAFHAGVLASVGRPVATVLTRGFVQDARCRVTRIKRIIVFADIRRALDFRTVGFDIFTSVG